MTLEDLRNVGELVGGVGVVVTLIYLAVRIQQNARSVDSSAYQSVSATSKQPGSFVFGMFLMASTLLVTPVLAGAQDLAPPRAVDLANSQIEQQVGRVESASAALSMALEALQQAQSEKPDRNDPRFSSSDDDGNTVLNQAMFAEAMSKWQVQITRLSSTVNQAKAKLSKEEAKLSNLQSRVGGAMSRDSRTRADALERKRQAQEKAMDRRAKDLPQGSDERRWDAQKDSHGVTLEQPPDAQGSPLRSGKAKKKNQ